LCSCSQLIVGEETSAGGGRQSSVDEILIFGGDIRHSEIAFG
jgi:hypothetical protein